MEKTKKRLIKSDSQTNILLNKLERKVMSVYVNSIPLQNILKEYKDYMSDVERQTESLYNDFKNETDSNIKDELKKAYISKTKELTLYSKQWKKIKNKFLVVISQVNQDALDIVNAEMPEIYALNYNNIANKCRKVGFKVEE